MLGQTFTRLTVIEELPNSWLRCSCYCGKEHLTRKHDVKRGFTKSCGCLRKETSAINQKHLVTHGYRNHILYGVWQGMIRRCTNPKREDYERYGGRGIKVCDRWLNIANFIEDMETTYQKGLSIDRINNNGNYEPDNCKWSTIKEQNNNRRPRKPNCKRKKRNL